MEKELISILIPMYNADKTVLKCLKSICNQTYKNIKIIVCDDGSTDNSYKIVENFAKLDNRIILLHKENEQNVSKTRKFLLNHVNTKYFIFVDSDDIVKRKFVEHLHTLLTENNADCAAVSFKINRIIPFSYIFSKKTVLTQDTVIPFMILSRKLHFVLWNKIFKTEIVKSIDINTSIKFGEDFAFCYDYFKRCKKVVFANKYDYKYILRKGSLIHQKFSQDYINFLNYLEDLEQNETDNNLKEALRCWICFTCAYYKQIMKKTKYKDEDLINRLNSNINKFDNVVRKTKKFNHAYRLIYRFLKQV